MKFFRFLAFWAGLILLLCPPAYSLTVHGFLEGAAGVRLVDNPSQSKDFTLGEGRLQLELTQEGPLDSRLYLKGDLIGDVVREKGDADLREFYLDHSPFPFLDVRLGRQIITWGTGDLIFVNDLFPKDFNAFFVGRNMEYLKIGSDAAKLSIYPGPFSLDIVAIPRFTPSEVPDGERLSFFNPFANRLSASGERLSTKKPSSTLGNTEIASRIYRNFGSYEAALYGFRGFFKEPAGVDTTQSVMFYPKLSTYGSSLRGPFLGGIGSVEFGYNDSREDRSGTNPLIENSSLKYLLGYEHELWSDFTVRAQYFVEQMLDYGEYKTTLPAGAPEKSEFRHLLFLRLTQFLRYQTMQLSFVGFYSPSDKDGMLNPEVSYKINDRWSATSGVNVFFGKRDYTQFGQLTRDDNLYLRLRAGF